MNFGISTNTALVVASSALIETLLQSQLSQIQAAQTVAEGQGKIAQAGASATIQAGKEQAYATVCDAFSSLAQGVASGVAAGASFNSMRESNSLLSTRDAELGKITAGRNDLSTRAEVVGNAGEGATAPTAATEADMTTAKNRIKAGEAHGLEAKTLTNAQINELNTAYNAREKEIDEKYNFGIKQTEAKYIGISNLSQAMQYAATAAASGTKASFEAAKAQQDAIAQIANSSAQQTQQSYQQILDSRQNLAQEISKVLDMQMQALQAVNYRG